MQRDQQCHVYGNHSSCDALSGLSAPAFAYSDAIRLPRMDGFLSFQSLAAGTETAQDVSRVHVLWDSLHLSWLMKVNLYS